jgi:hypothetical protein
MTRVSSLKWIAWSFAVIDKTLCVADRFPAELPATTVGFPSTRKGIDNLPILRYVSSHQKKVV